MRWRDRPVRTLKRSVTSAPSSGRQLSSPRSVYSRAVSVVVVAGPDVDVATKAGTFAPDDEADLGVGLQPDKAVDDVGPGLLQPSGPDDVGLLVEAGLDLDEDHDLLAPLGCPDQVVDDRRVARGPVQGQLDRQDLGVVDGLADEPLDRGDEAFVGMVDKQVTRADRRQDVGRLVLVRRHEAGRRDRGPSRALEVGPIKVRDLAQAGEVEHPLDLVGVLIPEPEAAQKDLARRHRHRAFDFEPDRLAEPPPAELLLDREEEVVRLVLLEGEVGVPRHPEEVVLDDLHPAEQEIEVGLDDLVEEDEPVRLDLEQAGQDLGDLDPGELASRRTLDRGARQRSTGSASRCTGTDGPGRPRAASGPDRSRR